MTDNEQPRDTSAPSTEGLYGREAELVKAGFTVKKDEPADQPETIDSDIGSLKEAAADVAASRDETRPVELSVDEYRAARDQPDPKEAVTVEQAAAELASARSDVESYVDGINFAKLAEDVDKARLQQLKANPKSAETFGFDVQHLQNFEAQQAAAQGQEPPKAEAPAAPAADGLDPEVEKALKHPQVRQAIEEELGRVESAKQGYSAALATAQQYAQANLLDHFPELSQLAPDQWGDAIGMLNQSDPQRVARAMGVLQRVDDLQKAQTQWQHMQAAEQQQQFKQYIAAEDAKFEQMPEWSGLNTAQRGELAEAVVEYAGELGVDRETLGHIWQTNPIIRHSAFQKMMIDAVRYRQIMKAPKPRPTHAVRPVQRPGASQQGPRVSDSSSRIAGLEKQLATASTKNAVKIAAQIISLKRGAQS